MTKKIKTSEALINEHLHTGPHSLSIKTSWANLSRFGFDDSTLLQICYPVNDELLVQYCGNEIEIIFNAGHRAMADYCYALDADKQKQFVDTLSRLICNLYADWQRNSDDSSYADFMKDVYASVLKVIENLITGVSAGQNPRNPISQCSTFIKK